MKRTHRKRDGPEQQRMFAPWGGIPSQPKDGDAVVPEKLKSRKRNEIWDAVVVEWWTEGVPDSQLKRVGKAVAEFVRLGATPDEIRVRRKRIRSAWRPGTDTMESVVKHWGEFTEGTSLGGGVGLVQE